MPIVTIRLMEGRDPDRIEDMITGVSHAIADAIDAPLDTVRVMVTEMQEHQYGVGGRPIRAVKAERAGEAGATASTDTGEQDAARPGGVSGQPDGEADDASAPPDLEPADAATARLH